MTFSRLSKVYLPGYGEHVSEDLVVLLKMYRIEVVVDIDRDMAPAGYQQETLRRSIENTQITYHWAGAQ